MLDLGIKKMIEHLSQRPNGSGELRFEKCDVFLEGQMA